MSSKNHYQNKSVLVIGGSYGIGKALCIELANKQANLTIIARSKDKLIALNEQLKGNHSTYACDISQPQELEKCFKELNEKCQKIDLVIFCVGIYQPMNIDNFDLNKAKEIGDINFTSFLQVLFYLLPSIKQKKMNHLAITSSIAGYFGMPNSLAYGASKAALSHFCESLYYELKPYQTKLQLINPGFVKTRLTDKNDFSMPHLITSKQAAHFILKQLPKNKFEIKFPFIFTQTMKLLSLLPYKIRFWLFYNKQ